MNQFKTFCFVGIAGFLIDSISFATLYYLSNEVMASRLLAFWLAATATWMGNRRYTFNQSNHLKPIIQWGRHMLSAHASGSINLGLFVALQLYTPLPAAFVTGVLAGLVSNFIFSRYFVFAERQQ